MLTESKRYKHGGKDVFFISGKPGDFLNDLHSREIYPRELPDLENHVYMYDRGECFALVRPICLPETEDIEYVYVTNDYPEDGWDGLILDIDMQRTGCKPAIVRTRIEMALDEAIGSAWDALWSRHPDWTFFDFPNDENQMEGKDRELFLWVVKEVMAEYGYRKSTVGKIFTHDHVDLGKIGEYLLD